MGGKGGLQGPAWTCRGKTSLLHSWGPQILSTWTNISPPKLLPTPAGMGPAATVPGSPWMSAPAGRAHI